MRKFSLRDAAEAGLKNRFLTQEYRSFLQRVVNFEICPACEKGKPETGHSGYPDKCFHCDTCGYLECADNGEVVAIDS